MNEWKWWMKSLRECVSSKCTAGKSHLESLWKKYEGQSCFVFVLRTWQNCRVSSCISAVLTMVRWQLALWKDTAGPVLLRKLQRYSSSCSFEKIAEIQQLQFFWENCKYTAASVLLRKLLRYSGFCSVEKIAKRLQLLLRKLQRYSGSCSVEKSSWSVRHWKHVMHSTTPDNNVV